MVETLKANILGKPEEITAPLPGGTGQFQDEPTNFFPLAEKESKLVSTFMNMDIEEQRKVLIQDDPIYAKMQGTEQLKFLNNVKEDTIMIAQLFARGGIQEGTPEFNTAQQIFLNAKPWIEPAADIAALTVGGIVGAPLGPFGAVASAGLALGIERNLFKMIESLLGLREPQGFVKEAQDAVVDVEEGMLFEGGGQLIKPVLGPVVKGVKERVIDPLLKKSTLTKAGAIQRAKDIIEKQIKGTPITQPQIDENVRLAKELQAKIRKELPDIAQDFSFTMGQLTDDASTVALERVLARKEGIDLTQSQRQHGVELLRQYYNKKVLSTGTVENLVQYTERMAKELEAATKQAENAVMSEVKRLSRNIDEQLIGRNIFEKLAVLRSKMSDKVSALFEQIPNFKIKPTALAKKMAGIRGDALRQEPAGDFPEEMFKFINAQIRPSGIPGVAVSDITVKQLQAINRSLNSAIKQAGKSGNGVAGHRLRQLKDAVTESIEETILRGSVDKKGMTVLRKANALRTSMGNRFDKSTVADVLSRGVRGEETRIAKANIGKAFDSLDGIDDLIIATNSAPVAKSMMKSYYKYSLTNFTVDAEGKVVAKKAATWLLRNKKKLEKLGLIDDFKSLEQKQRIVDETIITRDVFNKSVAGRLLEADVDSMVVNAYRGSKNLPQTTRELLKLVKGDKAAEQGLKKAFAEFLTRESESATPGFLQAIGGSSPSDIKFLESMSKMNALFKKFKPSIRIMFADEPAKFRAIEDIWLGLRIIERTAKSPIGAGSPTAELIFGETALARVGAATLGGVRPGWLYPYIFVNKWIQKHGASNVEQYLTKAIFDPEYAAVMTREVRSGVTPASQATIARLMRKVALNALLLTSGQERRQGKGAPVAQVPPIQ